MLIQVELGEQQPAAEEQEVLQLLEVRELQTPVAVAVEQVQGGRGRRAALAAPASSSFAM